MAQLVFSNEEITTLLQTLQNDQSSLRMEIGGTDSKEFRDGLKATEAVIQGIIEKLERSQQGDGIR
ncbi:MAG: hypothetical protein IT328_12200 [Caldilineaceae bacterium]|nr:hypothetical protein [Caldilineaceae bacterium]